jgi:LacI family transcriptional regulator
MSRRVEAGTVTARLRDVAEQAGVSIGLVSRILNGDPRARASASTRAWVSSIANDLGYRPNVTARALKSARTDTLGVVAPDLTNAFFTELMRGIEDRAGQLGYTVLLGRAESMYEGGQVARMVEHGRVDGFILQGRDDESIESLTRLVSGAPSVLVHGRLDGHPGSVMFDDSYAAHLATSQLIVHGHRRIGLIGGLPGLLTAQRREHGYRRALVDHGLRPQSRLITHFGYHPHEARAGLEELIASGPMPTAVVVANVNAALGVLTAARNSGLVVPDDLSVVAIHDSWVCDHTWPPLTTVRTPLFTMGRTAVQQLHHRLGDGEPEDVMVTDPPPTLIVRESVAVRR